MHAQTAKHTAAHTCPYECLKTTQAAQLFFLECRSCVLTLVNPPSQLPSASTRYADSALSCHIVKKTQLLSLTNADEFCRNRKSFNVCYI
jgi:hypothetical protein